MKRKNNWNLLGVIVLIAMCAFMFISCQQGPTLKPYKTLTLDIDGQQQKLYYGDDKAWYNALSEGGLLIDDNKVTGDVKFNISETTNKWTVTFKKNIPNGASESDFTITPASVDVTSELSLSPDNVIDITTGKVIPSSISEDVIITGTYPSKAIDQSVTVLSDNVNYEFAGWTVNGKTIDNITTYKVSGDTEIVANWKNLSDLKVLTVKDGDVVKDTAYYNLTDSKWYADENMTGEKTSVIPPEVQEKPYTITIDYENGTPDDIRTVTSSFLGYGVGSEVKVQAGGSLSGYTINEDTELVFLWSEEKITEPSQPTKDGYVFNGWYNGEKSYDFNSVVTGNITITAHWTKKTFNTLTLDIAGKKQKLYYGSDSAWYSALGEGDLLLDANKVTGDDVKFIIPSDPTWTVRFNKNTPAGANADEITISRESVVLTPELSLSPNNFIDKTSGKVRPNSISENVIITGTYPPKAIGQDVTASSDNENYEFAGWTVNGKTIENIADYEVSGNTEIVANWKNTSEFKILTVKDGESVKDIAYYNTTSKKWYKERSTTSEVKTSVVLPGSTTKTYTITLKYNNGSEDVTSTLNSTFSGYGLSGADSANIPASGELKDYTIENDTVLVSKWSEAKITKPENPTRDGYVFDKWTLNDTEYNFDNAVTADITLVAVWTQKTYKTLTLNITDSDTQTLYYGSDKAWYKALGEDQLLLDANKVTGDVKFNIPSAPTWTVTFDKNIPDGASESEFTVSANKKTVTPDLTLTPDNTVDASSGKVKVESIIDNVTVTGTYPPTAIGEEVTASSTNANYKFEKWTANGDDVTDIANYKVNGDTNVVANWKNISSFKVLTVKDGVNEIDTAYYNATDKKWYVSNDVTSKLKTSVSTLPNREYTITLNYDNNGLNETRSEKVTSSFLGYGTNDNTSAVIEPNGLLSDYTIDKDTELVSLWSKEKYSEPAQPTKDGYVFEAWYNGENLHSFDSVVTEDITITAHWKEKPKKLTVKDGVNEIDTAWFYTIDKKWYANENMTEEKTSVDIPQDRTYTLTLDYANDSPNGNGGSVTSSFLGYGTDGTTSAVIGTDGLLSGYTISDATELVSLWSEVKFDEPSEQPAKDGYVFDKWYKDGKPYDFNSVVKGDITLTAHWTKKTFNTLTFDITGLEPPVATQTLYYGSDNAWYKALSDGLLLDVNKVEGDNVKFNIPEDHVWTVALNKNRPQNAPFSDADIILSKNQLTLYPKDGVFSTDEYISKDGKVKVPSITENVDVTLDTSRRYPSENVEATTPDSIKLLGWLNGDEKITDLSKYEVTADNISLNASWGYKVSIGELKVPGVGISDADRGFYTTTQDIDESVDDKSKQQRVAYYAEGETVKLYYCNSSIRDIEITLKNEWSGETKSIGAVDTYKYKYSLLEIASMANQPLSISFNVTSSEKV